MQLTLSRRHLQYGRARGCGSPAEAVRVPAQCRRGRREWSTTTEGRGAHEHELRERKPLRASHDLGSQGRRALTALGGGLGAWAVLFVASLVLSGQSWADQGLGRRMLAPAVLIPFCSGLLGIVLAVKTVITGRRAFYVYDGGFVELVRDSVTSFSWEQTQKLSHTGATKASVKVG